MKTLFAVVCLASALSFAQQNSSPAQSNDMHDMKGMNMPGHDMSQMPGMSQSDDSSEDASAHAMHSMEGHHMDMGPHMKMTTLRPTQPGDAERAHQIVVAARSVMEKYKDYHTALNDGFRIFHPEQRQKQYHFTNYRNAFQATFKF